MCLQFGCVFFWQKEIGAKFASKMVKLTWQKSKLLSSKQEMTEFKV